MSRHKAWRSIVGQSDSWKLELPSLVIMVSPTLLPNRTPLAALPALIISIIIVTIKIDIE